MGLSISASAVVAVLVLLISWTANAFVPVPPSPAISTSKDSNNIITERRRSTDLQVQPLIEDDASPAAAAAATSVSSADDRNFGRGKVNEIDFCMAPSDVSLSRSYGTASTSSSGASGATSTSSGGGGLIESLETKDGSESTAASGASTDTKKVTAQSSTPLGSGRRVLSLTRSLNNASNRAVRRILLSRSWPSAEALNLSLRQVLSAKDSAEPSSRGDAEVAAAVAKAADLAVAAQEEKDGEEEEEEAAATAAAAAADAAVSTSKCPVPRPVLNIIMRRKDAGGTSIGLSDKAVVGRSGATGGSDENEVPIPRSKRGRTDEEWVAEQLAAFRESYGALPGYQYADAYLDCILNLATSGIESPRVAEVLAAGVYDEAYMRVISVLKSVGVVFEDEPDSSDLPRKRIASKLVDKDICLSMVDKLTIAKEKKGLLPLPTEIIIDGTESMAEDAETDTESSDIVHDTEASHENESSTLEANNSTSVSEVPKKEEKKGLRKLLFWMKEKDSDTSATLVDESEEEEKEVDAKDVDDNPKDSAEDEDEEQSPITPEDLGAVLLSAKEPTMTRQLNVLSNIVQRALLFGGDQELLVLAETLEADKPAFVQRWYRGDADGKDQPGAQYFSALVQLLKNCYENGVQTELEPPLPLSQSYANAYERLVASCIELGSGYIKPTKSKDAVPKSAKEELGRFARWETSIRQTSPDVSSYPDDMVGTWQVKDEVGGKTIGVSNVVLKPQGEVVVKPPLQGLRWRLDPGPTHLDTCTFQVLSDDGAILQYRGFVDRGARLEARFSNRSIKIRGGVSFLMRDGDAALFGEDYSKDMLPINYQSGATRFVMSKVFDLS